MNNSVPCSGLPIATTVGSGPGERVELAVDPDRLRFFDPATGRRLR
ncbi:MAG: hypothetical protein ACR2HP_01200 [Ilumatobacteraceae bacterium]